MISSHHQIILKWFTAKETEWIISFLLLSYANKTSDLLMTKHYKGLEYLQTQRRPVSCVCVWDLHLTHSGLLTPYGDIYLGQQWLR